MDNNQYSGPTTTANSATEGRLKVDAGSIRRKKRDILKGSVYDGKGGMADEKVRAVKRYQNIVPQKEETLDQTKRLVPGNQSYIPRSFPVSNIKAPMTNDATKPYRPGDKFKNPNPNVSGATKFSKNVPVSRPGEKK